MLRGRSGSLRRIGWTLAGIGSFGLGALAGLAAIWLVLAYF